jgi:hypothetical protein
MESNMKTTTQTGDISGPQRERLNGGRFVRRAQNSRAELDRRLDEALEQTFPASDPVAIVISLRHDESSVQ